MTTFSIINPSDPYTIQGDFETCAVAVLYLGKGLYGMKAEDDPAETRSLPPFAFGGDKALKAWAKETLGTEGIVEWIADHLEPLAEVLESVLIGEPEERNLYEATMADLPDEAREKFAERWHDSNRSSMNDIGTAAWRTAKAFRAHGACKGSGAAQPCA